MQTRFIQDAEKTRKAVRLLSELQTTLACSQRALLSGDASGLEFQTAEQMRLLVELDSLIQTLTQPLAEASAIGVTNNRDSAADSGFAELRVEASRVLHLGKVQAALLARAQQRTRIISHVLAEPQAAYRAAAFERNQASALSSWRKGDRTRCRA